MFLLLEHNYEDDYECAFESCEAYDNRDELSKISIQFYKDLKVIYPRYIISEDKSISELRLLKFLEIYGDLLNKIALDMGAAIEVFNR